MFEGWGVVHTGHNAGEGSSVPAECCSPYIGKKDVVLLPPCAVSAVLECGSSLAEELINGGEGGKNTV